MDDLVGSYVDRFGNAVVLTDECWRHHILRDHENMEGFLWSFARVLKNPRRVTQDTSLDSCRCFYRDRIAPGELIKIVVEYPPLDPSKPLFSPVTGIIITAFVTPIYTRRERQLWP